MGEGGDGYWVFKEGWDKEELGFVEYEVLREELEKGGKGVEGKVEGGVEEV